MLTNKKLWQRALTEIELNISKANFSTWFKNTHIAKQEDGIIYLGVPNAFVKEWLGNKYHKFILKALRELSDHVRGLEYIICKESLETEQRNDLQPNMVATNELVPDGLYINKEDNLNPKYSFESFIVGSFNELPHAAAQAVIKKPGVVYNPLFIYGPTGLGKTHLIQAIGNHIKKTSPEKKVHYLTSEKFSTDYITSLQSGKINEFKEKYRKYDFLIMDDIQFLSNKEKTQEELFHMFNSLYDNNKQIIFSSDKHPHFITGLEDRLKSRLSAGMTVDIPTPDKESRMAIISAKAEQQGLKVSKEVVDYLAHTVNSNIRELEGAINTLFCHSQLKGKDVSITDVRNYVKNNVKPKRVMAVKDVVKIVADFYNIKEESIYEKTRHKEVIKPRQVIMYLLREDLSISYPSIGQKIGGRDHTTVIHSCEKIKTNLKDDQVLFDEINQIGSVQVSATGSCKNNFVVSLENGFAE